MGSAVGRDGGQAAVGAAGESPAALMHRPMMGPTDQGQVIEVGGAALEPVAQMMGLIPGQGAGTVGDDTAAVTDGQGGAVGGLDDPGGPADLQRLGRGPTQDRRQQGHGGPEPPCQPLEGVRDHGPPMVAWGRARVWLVGFQRNRDSTV